MSDSVSVTYGALTDAASGFNSTAGKLETTLNDLNSRVASLTSSFTGTTSAAFANNHKQLTTLIGNLHGVILQISSVLTEAENIYQHADRTAAGFFN